MQCPAHFDIVSRSKKTATTTEMKQKTNKNNNSFESVEPNDTTTAITCTDTDGLYVSTMLETFHRQRYERTNNTRPYSNESYTHLTTGADCVTGNSHR